MNLIINFLSQLLLSRYFPYPFLIKLIYCLMNVYEPPSVIGRLFCCPGTPAWIRGFRRQSDNLLNRGAVLQDFWSELLNLIGVSKLFHKLLVQRRVV